MTKTNYIVVWDPSWLCGIRHGCVGSVMVVWDPSWLWSHGS